MAIARCRRIQKEGLILPPFFYRQVPLSVLTLFGFGGVIGSGRPILLLGYQRYLNLN
jgi:hypothetical protein